MPNENRDKHTCYDMIMVGGLEKHTMPSDSLVAVESVVEAPDMHTYDQQPNPAASGVGSIRPPTAPKRLALGRQNEGMVRGQEKKNKKDSACMVHGLAFTSVAPERHHHKLVGGVMVTMQSRAPSLQTLSFPVLC